MPACKGNEGLRVESLIELRCDEFSAQLAAKAEVPGGGGAAALAGSLAIALGQMAGNYTVGKKTYAAVEPEVKQLLAEGESLRCRLLELVDEDACGFAPLSHAYAIPRDDPSRAETIEAATKQAAQAPLQMVRTLSSVVDMLERMERVGSKMLQSDVACGAALAAAAIDMAAVNVLVNAKSLDDGEYALALQGECDATRADAGARARAIANRITDSLRVKG